MTSYVFTGPTLSPKEAEAELDATILPPVSQGDVYRAALEAPRAIGIIDGYFEQVPAVWHKEILWAMAQGVHVFGSASMGALRAAELAPFGMRGVGVIFEAYRDGALTDDDEVAVRHGPAELGYISVSEAMVNIRATLASAETAQVISAATRRELEGIAKAFFYAERSYPAILMQAARAGLPASEIDAFRAWLPTERINQKRLDAQSMLREMRKYLADDPEPKSVSYAFEYTDMWDEVSRLVDESVFQLESA